MKLKTLALAAACIAVTASVWAQTTPKSAAKAASAAAGKTLSLGTGGGGGPLLTREELRACLNQEASIRSRRADLDTDRAALDKEKESITADRDAMSAERAPIDEVKQKVAELNARMKAYADQVKSWNERVSDFNTSPPSGAKGDKMRDALNAEREDLQKQQKVLEADKAKLSEESQGKIRDYNVKASALEARVDDWNKRNRAWSETAKSLEAERSGWVTSCADRRYREDDEIAIKKGK